jgi:tripartite motif-containing protein 71
MSAVIYIFTLIEVSYNRPKLPPCACWNPDEITFADRTDFVSKPSDMFVDRNNTVYVVDYTKGCVHEWREGSTTVTRTTFNGLLRPRSLFVTTGGDIYVDNGAEGKVEKWALNATKSIVVMNVSDHCLGLFVDSANCLYCSLKNEHRVVKQSLYVDTNNLSTVAGTGSFGSASNMLEKPAGIFVTLNFDLYVADCGNDRVQLFKSDQLNGLTVAGKSAIVSIELNCPTAVFLDADGYLFIVHYGNHRIVGSGPNGFFCLFGCSNIKDAAFYQLKYPEVAVFDSYGNIYVAGRDNNRIQKLILMKNTSGE